MLRVRATVHLGAMVMKGCSTFPKSSSITGNSPSDCLVSYLGHSFGGGYISAEVQSLYSIAPGDWAKDF